uniref:DUF4371 domain-containing protein n=1 Tax=Latimeria chalumnae TaxID=7897 RepID=H3A3J5_LATCH
RDVLVHLIDIILFLAKQGLPFHGHEEEVGDVNLMNHGNFLELIALLSKYDRVLGEHLGKVINEKSQNVQRICTMGMVYSHQSSRGMTIFSYFSIAMDCTTDIAHQDQASIAIRYIRSDLCVVGCLNEVVCVEVSSAESLLNILKGTFTSKGVDLQHAVSQCYNGAAVMSGQYVGVRALIEKENPNCLYIWTFDHALNLFIIQASSASLLAKQLFVLLEQTYNLISVSCKRCKLAVTYSQYTSHSTCQQLIGGLSEKLLVMCSSHVKKNFLIALWMLWRNVSLLGAVCKLYVKHTYEGLHKNLASFETVITTLLLKKIFDITDPASKYLQSESIDLLQAMNHVETSQSQLLELRNNGGVYEEIYESSISFCEWHDLEDVQFPVVRVCRKKRMDDEMTHNEIMTSAKERHRVNTFLLSLDVSVSYMNECFSSHRQILSYLALLNPSHFTAKEGVLPKDAFNICAQRYSFSKEALQKEYVTFVKAYPRLSNSGLRLAFPNIYEMYKTLVTLPVGSTKCECCFSKLKLIKTCLRSTMSSQCLASLIMIAVERSLIGEIDPSSIMSRFASSPLLQKI